MFTRHPLLSTIQSPVFSRCRWWCLCFCSIFYWSFYTDNDATNIFLIFIVLVWYKYRLPHSSANVNIQWRRYSKGSEYVHARFVFSNIASSLISPPPAFLSLSLYLTLSIILFSVYFFKFHEFAGIMNKNQTVFVPTV